MRVALVTGASRGLGRAVGEELAQRGWSLVIDARDGAALEEAATTMRATNGGGTVTAIAGDVADEGHRAALAAAARGLGRLDLLVNNASTLGVSPLLPLGEIGLVELRRTYEVNVVAPLALVQLCLPILERSSRPAVVNVTSDAAVEHYEAWGGYGSSKAAVEHLTATLATEVGSVRFLAVDPGDMRTAMHQRAFPGEDISDRPLPESVVPALLALVEGEAGSGRYRLAEVAAGL